MGSTLNTRPNPPFKTLNPFCSGIISIRPSNVVTRVWFLGKLRSLFIWPLAAYCCRAASIEPNTSSHETLSSVPWISINKIFNALIRVSQLKLFNIQRKKNGLQCPANSEVELSVVIWPAWVCVVSRPGCRHCIKPNCPASLEPGVVTESPLRDRESPSGAWDGDAIVFLECGVLRRGSNTRATNPVFSPNCRSLLLQSAAAMMD